MTTITTINSGDLISTSRTDINTNFANLNSDKIETSVLDTDTTLAANSDAKVATQKAVKAYVDAGGNVNASETARGIVEEATTAEVAVGTATGATGAKLFVTPEKLVVAPISPIRSVLAGATINGATLPVPVYQNTSDNEFYACDANDTATLKFLGFAISNGTNGNAMNVQFGGVVSGFTGLAEGTPYYVQDAVGTIGTTPGTTAVLVGIAISETQLMIQKGKRRVAGSFSSGTASGNQVITTGFRANRITFFGSRALSTVISVMHAEWVDGTLVASGSVYNEGSTGGTSGAVFYENSTSDYMTYSITNLTETSVRFDWTETGTISGQTVYYVIEGEI